MSYAVTSIDPQVAGDEIRALWRRNLPDATTARFDWLYGPNASGRAWLLRSDERLPIGSTGLMLRTMSVGGKTFCCGSAIDLNVDREHRTVGPALALQRALIRDAERFDIPLIYALPSPSAVPVMKRLGYIEIGEMRRWAKPLIAERKLRGPLRSRLLSHPAGFLADGWLRWTSAEREHNLPAGWSFTEIEPRVAGAKALRAPYYATAIMPGHEDLAPATPETTVFDDGFDDLWDAGRAAFPVVGERNAAYLRWRYGEYPDFTARVFCLHDEQHTLRGYAVICVEGELADLSDLWFADANALRLVLGAVLQTGRRLHWASLSVRLFAGWNVSQVLSEFGLKPRDARSVFVWVSPKLDEPTRHSVLDGAAWYLTRADSDTDV